MATDKKPKVKKEKHFKPISAFAGLFAIIAIMAGLTWVIPSGSYEMIPDPADSSKEIRKAGTYQEVEKVTTEKDPDTGEETTVDRRQGFWDIFMAPIKGMADKLDVIIFVLILGGFLGITMKTGAFNAGLGGLLKRMKGKEKWLIPVLMTLFAIGGTTYGMQEETVAFYALIIPVMLAAGYNAMVAVMIIVLGSGIGVLASTVNPFSTGIAARTAGVQLGSIIWPQLIILVLMLLAAIFFVMHYAAKTKKGAYLDDAENVSTFKSLDLDDLPVYNAKRKAIMAIFAVCFVVMIASLIPWEDFGVMIFTDFHNWLAGVPVLGAVLGAGHNVGLGSWYFNEISVLFLMAALLMALIFKSEFHRSRASVTDVFIKGSADLLAVAIIIAVAAGVSVIMSAGGIEDTIIHWGEEGLKGAGGGLVGVLAYLFYLPMSFIIPSTSGLATASMPVIAPVADLVGSSKETMVVAFANAEGIINMLAPTIASLMAGLTLAGVSYKNWLKRIWPIMIVLIAISLVAIFIMGSIG